MTFRLLMSGQKVRFEPYMVAHTEAPNKFMELIKQRYRWSRGILQVIRKLFKQKSYKSPKGCLLLFYMTVETLLLPVLNTLIAAGTIIYSIFTADMSLFSLWLIQLTALDIAATLFCMSDLRWSLRLALLSLVNRFTYAFALDISRIFASAEEFFKIRMNWGKLQRSGER